MEWRLGIDIGTNSLGFTALRLCLSEGGRWIPSEVIDMGVRIFSDGRNPKDGSSLAAMRRGPKGARKTRDRALNRNARYLKELQSFGLLPDPGDREATERNLALDPYVLRAKGLSEELTLHELGRALWGLKRRGFKSNRKADGDNTENGKIRDAAIRTEEMLIRQGFRTIGEWLGKSRMETLAANEGLPKGERHPLPQVRTRLQGNGAKAFYDFYPTREMTLREFDLLWEAQKKYHAAELTDEAYDTLRDTLSWQWPLKPQPVGKCTLIPTEKRAPKALPSVQRLRIYQDLNHLEYFRPGERPQRLTLEERDRLAKDLLSKKTLSFDGMRKALKLPPEARFNLESIKRKELEGDQTAGKLAGDKYWGKGWRDLPLDRQEEVVEHLLNTEDEAELIDWLTATHGLPREKAESVARCNLPQGHGALCREATRRVLTELEKAVVPYSTAVINAGFDSHSLLDDGERFDRLPYYGKILERHVAFGTGEPGDPDEKRYGKIANPTVHVALNQLGHVVNDLIRRFGPPREIVVELARDLPLSAKGKRDLESEQRKNQEANDRRREELARLGQPDNYENRLRLRLWEELDPENKLNRRCVYTGEQISVERLFSSEVEIEHLLPYSRTLDDGIGNKTVSMRWANRLKTNMTPHEAFSANQHGLDWEAITERAARLPKNKQWRFGPDAMDRFDREERDFLSRQLNDTRYMARIATEYLKKTCADVWVVPGRMTADLRWALGLDSLLAGHNSAEDEDPAKNRLDHRHHAVDALVVALTDRGMLQAVATQAAHAAERGDRRLMTRLDDPWPGFRDQVSACLDRMIVSHKPDHGIEGALHNDTAYGLIPEERQSPDCKGNVVHRVPLASFNKRADLTRIRDGLLREHFLKATEGVADKDLSAALVAEGEKMAPPVRRVRVVETLNVIPVHDRETGKPYKGYKGDANYCYDIYPDAKGKWTGKVVSRFEANQKGFNPRDYRAEDGTPLIMRLRVNDMLELERDGIRQAVRIVKFSTGKIYMAPHQEAGKLKERDGDKEDPFKYIQMSPSSLQKAGAVAIHLSPSGQVKYRGNLS